jgi:hypothetical protein
MKTIIRTALAGFFLVSTVAVAQVANDADGLYDSTTLVDTNNNSTSTSTVNSTSTNTNNNNNVNTTTVDSTSTNTNTNINTSTSVNTNNNINSGEQTFNNNNVNTTTSTNTNNNNNVNTSTSTSTNNNNNVNSSTSTNTNNNVNQNINSGTMTNINKNETKTEQTVKSPPPTAVAPSMMSGGNSDLCTTGTSGAVQTQILGVSSGGTVRDKNCERLKNAKVLYDMGMKVAAVATLCQDRRVFDAMWNAGTPCPFEGEIGARAKAAWEQFPEKIPAYEEEESDPFYRKSMFGALLGYLLFIL